MHILWLKTELLHPVDKGGKIRTYQTLKHLKSSHQITYLCLDDGSAAPDAEARADEYCHALVTVPFAAPRKGTATFYGDLARNVFSSLPYAVAKYRSAAMREAIVRAVSERHVDLVVCDFLFPSINLPSGLPVPCVLFQHNVEAAIWERHASTAGHPVKRAYMRSQWRRMAAWEGRECLRFDHVIAVSEDDATAMRRAYGAARVSHVPTGVDVDFFRRSGTVAREPGTIVFIGSMDWMPNEDGVAWFAEQVLPRIRSQIGNARFVVVGRNPSPAVVAMAARDAMIEVTGTVPDVRPYLERADVVVVPLRIGGGTRLKIFEGMGMECAIVSTTVGAEGLPLTDGDEIRITDDPSAFASACVALVRDPVARDRMGTHAALRVRRDFGWQHAASKFADDCEAAAVDAARRPPRAVSASGSSGPMAR